ncbi:hypothetical protein B0H12DRAFT_313563 [Mycena haematopus]|nr:hypothetical protein B0H12DRAFT_313563 [Mycena haematopus]
MFTLFLLIFVDLSRAFTLSLPNELDSGTRVIVQWSRSNADPNSFGLMQRSLEGNEPILSVTPVENAGGAASGTVSVLFNTPGQVILAGIAQLSLSSGETPNQLSAGKQLTVVPVSNAVNVPDTTTTTSTSTRGTTLSSKGPSNTSPATDNSIQIQTTQSLTSADPLTPTPTPTRQTPTSTAGGTGVVSSPLVTPSKSSVGTSVFVPQSSPFSVTQSVSGSSTLVAPSSSAKTTDSFPQSATNATKSGLHHSTVIALAVILPLLSLLLVLFYVIHRQRTSTRFRIDAFTAVWSRRHPANFEGTISSFGDVEAGWAAADRPVHHAVLEPDPHVQGAVIPHPSPIARRQQKLQLMVERLSERNAALEREVDTLASAPMRVHQPDILDGLGLGPPPVYTPESMEAPTSKLR